MKRSAICALTVLAFSIPALLGIPMTAGHAAAQGQGQGSASVTIAGPLPLPVAGTVKIDSLDNTVHIAGTVPVSFTAPTLFRGQLETGGPDVTITNNTSKTLVIDFVDAFGGSDVYGNPGPVTFVVSGPGEQHLYWFYGPVYSTQNVVVIAQPTKIIVKPGETLSRETVGTAEVTGHYE